MRADHTADRQVLVVMTGYQTSWATRFGAAATLLLISIPLVGIHINHKSAEPERARSRPSHIHKKVASGA